MEDRILYLNGHFLIIILNYNISILNLNSVTSLGVFFFCLLGNTAQIQMFIRKPPHFTEMLQAIETALHKYRLSDFSVTGYTFPINSSILITLVIIEVTSYIFGARGILRFQATATS